MSRHQADDAVGQFVAQWRASRLDLDPAPTEVIGRITRLARIFQRRADGWLAEFDLTWETFAVLGALLRQGPPYRLTPTALYRQALLTSGAITNRIARAEAMGWVAREPDPLDARSSAVRLTPKGLKLANRVIERHFAEQARLLDVLGEADRNTLARLLSLLAAEHEQEQGPGSTGGTRPVTRAGTRRARG
jgi:DNA-binding MarR family transcriptional regulator